MQGTFHQYHLNSVLTKKHSHATYLASPTNDPERQMHLTVFATSQFPFPHDREKLLQKAQEINALEYPYLLPILDLGVEEGQPFVVREYLPQGSLRSHLLKLGGSRLEMGVALTIVLQVGGALVYAHSRQVLHRNLKLENILFDAHGHALLTDFSLVTGTDAIIRDQAREEYAFCYLAPEQLAGTCDARSDQYALGCLTYELLTGQVPFVGQRLSSLMAHPSHVGPLPLSEIVADLPASLEAAVLKTLAKDPAERFVDCAQFLDVVRAVLLPPPVFTTGVLVALPPKQEALPADDSPEQPLKGEEDSEASPPKSDAVPLSDAITSEEPAIRSRLPKEERDNVWPPHASLEEQEALSLMSAPASSVYESSAFVRDQTIPLPVSRPDQPEAYMRQAAGRKRRPIVLALVLSVVLASITSALWLSGIAKPETGVRLSNKGTTEVLLEKNIPTGSPSKQATTPTPQVTSQPVVQSPVQATPLPTTTQPPVPTPTSASLPPATYEAEASQNALIDGAQVLNCGSCSGGYRVGYLGLRPNGNNGALWFKNVNKGSAGQYTLTISYANGASQARNEYVSINGGSMIVFSGSPTGSFSTFATVQFVVNLNAGSNTITFYNPEGYAPDIDWIII